MPTLNLPMVEPQRVGKEGNGGSLSFMARLLLVLASLVPPWIVTSRVTYGEKRGWSIKTKYLISLVPAAGFEPLTY